MQQECDPGNRGAPCLSWRSLPLLAFTSLLLLAVQMAAYPATEAQQLAREVLQNEIQAEANERTLWSYRDLSIRDGKEMLFEYCETKEGTLHRLLAVNGRPLNPHERQAEDRRIGKLLRSPDAVREAKKQEEADARKERKFLTLFPDAFLYREEGQQGELVKLAFAPNPNFHPSGYMARALHCLQGTMVVDVKQKRLVSVDGRLRSEVKFLGGLLGHLNSGGTFSVSLQEVASGDWELKSLQVEMSGKALIFKSIGVQEQETYSRYDPVSPSASLAQAAERLLEDSTNFTMASSDHYR
jgi:hypothetical protein